MIAKRAGRSRRRRAVVTAAVTLATWTGFGVWLPSSAEAAAPCAGSVAGDVNGDGHAEAAVGEPFNNNASGGVHIFYGQPEGLVADPAGTALNDQFITQDSAGVPGAAETDDLLGFNNLLADFNGDRCADLAVGVPGENAGRGLVLVLYGSASGLTTAGVQSFTENTLFGAGAAVPGEEFGRQLTSGDLNDDGVADLVVGAPGELAAGAHGGGVVVVYGSPSGLGGSTTPTVVISQASPGVPGVPEDSDDFGSALATGDFNGNGVDDLAVGVPGENNLRGIVQVLPGSAGTGVGRLAAVTFSQDSPGVPGASEAFDGFGSALAAGDVTGDGRADLAVGAPGENGPPPPGGEPAPIGAGAVSFLRGSATGLTGTGSQIWGQNSTGVDGVAGETDQFGASLAMARLDNGPLLDLAIGTPGDAVGPIRDAGSVTILLGRPSGLSTAEAGGQRFHQNTDGIAGTAESGEAFGLSVAAPLIQTPDEGSLLIGVPGETVNGVEGTGLFHQLATFEFGPNPIGSRTFHLDSPGVKGQPGSSNLFGFDVS